MRWFCDGTLARSWWVHGMAILVPLSVLAACTGANGDIVKADTSVASPTSSSTSSTTSTTSTTSTIPVTTVVDTSVPTTLPGDPGVPPVDPPVVPGGGDPNPAGDPTAVVADVVRPPASWVGFGIPQPGSMFENLQADRSFDGAGKVVALTFDDGPSQYTSQIVSILQFLDVKATFFQITRQAEARPDVVKLMAAAGMRIGSHTRNHPHLRELSPADQAAEVYGSIDALNTLLSPVQVKCFRPPYAQYTQQVIDMVGERGVATAMWSFDTLDWKKPPWQSIAARTVENVKDRQIILMHDGGGDRTQTIQALPWIIQGLRAKGFTIVPIC